MNVLDFFSKFLFKRFRFRAIHIFFLTDQNLNLIVPVQDKSLLEFKSV